MDPYIGEIRMFGGNFAPEGWALCNGQALSISEYEALYSLIGTTYGGDGQSTFNLPDLRGRVPIHMGQGTGLSNYTLGSAGGAETVALTTNQLPAHTHQALAQGGPGNVNAPGGAVWASSNNPSVILYAQVTANTAMAAQTTPAGGSQPHDNLMPYQAVNFIIALNGIYPPQG